MGRFSVGFGKRKSSAAIEEELQNAQNAPQPSFRVLERTDVPSGKSFDGGASMAKPSAAPVSHHKPEPSRAPVAEDNMFADLKTNRGSGSSNTTKTASTDTSSRHSNVSTAPSSADFGHHAVQEEWKPPLKKTHTDMAGSAAVSKPPSRGFLERASRTFSFGGQKKNPPVVPSSDDEQPPPPPVPPMPAREQEDSFNRRSRGLTDSTTSTATPPTLDQQDFSLDMGSDFGQMFDKKFKRNSAMTLRAMAVAQQEPSQQEPAQTSSTNERAAQPTPAPIRIDNTSKVEPSPYSWSSQNSGDNLLRSGSDNNTPPPVPRHGSPLAYNNNSQNRPSDIVEDEDARLLQESLAASRFLGDSGDAGASKTLPQRKPVGRFRRNEDSGSWQNQAQMNQADDENMFAGSLAQSSRVASRYVSKGPSPPQNKVMTPAQFERYRKDKERQTTASDSQGVDGEEEEEEEDNYEDDEDEVEKAKQAAKQRRKQEAHMTVYRQQMMKVTGESNNPPRPGLPLSMSSPSLSNLGSSTVGPDGKSNGNDEDEDEEIPLAILAAHGFPNKNKTPNRMSTMSSNPDLRVSMLQQPQQQQQLASRPGTSLGDGAGPSQNNRASTLPAFARRLPQDPFVGASLVNGPSRESMNYSGGSPAPAPAQQPQGPLPPGGLVGVIASEERSRAMRRGSPHVDTQNLNPGGNNFPGGGFDPMHGVPPQMMYNTPQMMPQQPQLTPGDQAQIHMTQQMQQFMQMQMQFMQMMSNGGQPNQMMGGRPMSHMPSPTAQDMGSRQSFMGDPASPMMDQAPPRPGLEPHMRTMSMVQPNSESWIHPGAGGYAPSVHARGTPGYTPSIAPSERSNVGLPGRYRPVSQAPQSQMAHSISGQSQGQDLAGARRTSTMSGGLGGWDHPTVKSVKHSPSPPLSKSADKPGNDDDDDEQGWEAMKAKREKKRSMWKTKKTLGSDISAYIQ